ncbi:MAG: hypothetical protein C4304_04090 [candidate division GAL15 bacterium]
MKVSAQEVRSSPGGRLRLQLDVPVSSGAEEVLFVVPVRGEVELRAVGNRLRLVGQFRTEAELACGRCLRNFRRELCATVDEWYDPDLPLAEEVPVEDGVLVLPLSEPEVDVTEVARQHLLLACPLVALCRPDCAGLCTECGADRNTTPCDCAARRPDPRWQVLQNVLGGP